MLNFHKWELFSGSPSKSIKEKAKDEIKFSSCRNNWTNPSTEKQLDTLSTFRSRIKIWKGQSCDCRLCKCFVAQVLEWIRIFYTVYPFLCFSDCTSLDSRLALAISLCVPTLNKLTAIMACFFICWEVKKIRRFQKFPQLVYLVTSDQNSRER